MNKALKSNELFFVCTEGVATSVVGAKALKDVLVANGLSDVNVRHIQTSWLPKDAKLVICHKNIVDDVKKKAPEAYVVGVTDFMKAPEYATLAQEMVEARK